MTPKERIEKLDQLFDHIMGLAMNQTGPEGMCKFTQALQETEWLIRGETELMKEENDNGKL